MARMRGSSWVYQVASSNRSRITPSATFILKPSRTPPFRRVIRPTQEGKSSAMWASQCCLKSAGRPAAAGQAEGGVPARRHAIHADLVEGQQRCEPRVPGYRVDGARDFGRPAFPALRAAIRRILEVVASVFRHGDHEACVDQCAGEIGMNPGRATRPMRHDDEAAVAANGCGLAGQIERERAEALRLVVGGRGVVHGDRPVALQARDLGRSRRRLGRTQRPGPSGR